MTCNKLRHLLADCGGTAVIELALIAPVLALVVVGIVDISNGFSRKLALEQGTQRAVEKILQTTDDDTVEGTLKAETVCQVNGMNNDGSCKTYPISASNVTVTYRLECRNNTSQATTTQTNPDPAAFDLLTCPATDQQLRYIEVAATDKYTPMFSTHFAAVDADGTYHLSATAGMRTQ